MAMMDAPRPLSFGTLALQRIASRAGDLFARIQHWREVRRTVRILSELDDDQLDDLGLTRGDIAAFARHGRI